MVTMDDIVSLCKRRGFVFPNSEIYGGFANAWDYGPLGVEMMNNLKHEWWRDMVQLNPDIEGMDGAIISHPIVWEASGHLQAFTDPLVECKSCHKRFRADHMEEKGITKCPNCGGEFTPPRSFNLLVETSLGVTEDSKQKAYARGETAQNIYLNYELIKNSMRKKIPFGIAQIGKSFRNEITPGNFIFRTREFEQMEMQYFVNPKDVDMYFKSWQERRMKWHLDLGVKEASLRIRQHTPQELAHYNKYAYDIDFNFPFGWGELEGTHNRGDWDLTRHGKYSGKDFTYTDIDTGQKYVPYIVECAVGVTRLLLVHLVNAYEKQELPKGDTRIVLHLDERIAPIKYAILPLMRRDGLDVKAKEVFDLLAQKFMCQYDDTGSIGKRYRRQDEIGTPRCITIDYNTLKDDTVTIRDRDSMEQVRIPISEI